MSDPLMEQIKNAISNVSDRIKGYTEAADGFVKGVTGETVRLDLLTKKLKDCLEKLQKLKDDYNILIQKITALEVQITSLKSITSEAATSAGTEACNGKLNEILGLINVFGESVGDFNGDVEGLKGQVTALEKVIGGICNEADQLVQQQQYAEGARKKLADKLGGEAGEKRDSPEVEQKEDQSVLGEAASEEEDLPEGWQAVADGKGNTYYYNIENNKTQWEKPGSKAERDRWAEGMEHVNKGLNAPHGNTSPFTDPSVTAGVFRKQAQAAEKKVRLKDFQKYVDSDAFKSVADRAGKRERLLNWWKEHDYTHMGEPDAYTKKEHLAMNEAVMKGRPAASALTKGGRRTRKKRGGWQTPEKLQSLSKTKIPIRRLGSKNKKKKNKKKKTRGRNRRKKNKKRTKRRR